MKKTDSYKQFLISVKEQISSAQVKTVIAANSQMLWLYWQLGDYILQNQNAAGWGAKVIDKLSADIRKDFPLLKGFSARNLKYMRKFAETYPVPVLQQYIDAVEFLKNDPQKIQQVMAKMEAFESQSFIIVQQPVAQSRNVLMMQIESGLFKRQVKAEKISNFSNTLPAIQTDFATYMLKDPYIFDFVQAKDKADERDIERQLTEHVTKFLLELGQGFAFVGKQVHFEIGQKDFYVDLLFYHIKLRSYVVVELKADEFEPGDAGQINFYVNLVNDKLKTAEDNDTIGILLCKGKNKVLAEYALKSIKHPIGVSDYQLSKAIPEELRSQLPKIDDLEKELINQ